MKERLTKKVSSCFCYDLKDHKNVPGEFASYDAFFDYNMAVKRLGEYEDTGLEPEEINDFVNSYKTMRDNEEARVRLMCGTGVILPERAAEITKAESEGRLLVLPCKPMTTVYVIEHVDCYMDTEACPMLDESGRCNGEGEMPCPLHIVEVVADIDSLAKWIVLNAFGKTVFRTREEAEARLKEREGT